MGMVDQAVINFACYEDAKDFLGLASVTLPDVDFIVTTVSGAGIAGNVEAPIIGHMNAAQVPHVQRRKPEAAGTA